MTLEVYNWGVLKRQKIVVIDGYNVLRNSARYADFVGAAPNFEDWTSEVWNAAREALLNDVLKTLDKNSQAIIVYDAAKRETTSVELPSQKMKNTQVIFTDTGESADARIQKLVYASRQKGLEVQVVTSDLAIQDATMNNGVVRTSSREFIATISDQEHEVTTTQQANGAMRMHNNKASLTNSSKLTAQQANAPMRIKIEDVVDHETAVKLRHLRDSL